MSNCCTPEYIKIDFLSPTGSIVVQRGSGNEPSCGYYELYTGNPEFGNYDYHELDLQYNSGSGYWIFSGDSEIFSGEPLYRSVLTGNPCNPLGVYSGGIYEAIIVETNKWDLYEFDPSYVVDTGNIYTLNIGSGVHLNRDVKLNCSFLDSTNQELNDSQSVSQSSTFDYIIFDILDEDGVIVKPNYQSGINTELIIGEQDNIDIFGEYQKDFGVRISPYDKYLGRGAISEFYFYGNKPYINNISVQDISGTSTYVSTKTGSLLLDQSTSGKRDEEVDMQISLASSSRYTKYGLLNLYASKDKNFEINDSSLINRYVAKSSNKSINLNEQNKIKPNEDYYFAVVAENDFGSGNIVNFGPHKIKKVEQIKESIAARGLQIGKDKQSATYFENGTITGQLTGASGIIDHLFINKEDYNNIKNVYQDEVKFLYSTIPTDISGIWQYTTFEYETEFKNPLNPYQNISKKIKLTATGSSIDPFNSGMPLFEIKDYDTGFAVELAIGYVESGLYLLANTGHGYIDYKYRKTSY